MAKFTADLQQPVRAASIAAQPQRGIADTSTAEFISGMGELGLEVDRQYQVESAANEMEAERQSFLTRFDETVKGETGVPEIDTLSTELERLAAAKKMGLSETQFRVRSESILKKHIAGSPGYGREMRQRSAQILGYDPSGESVMAAFQALDAAERGNQDPMKLEQKRIAQGTQLGIPVGLYTTNRAEWEAKYNQISTLSYEKSLLDAQDAVDVRTAPKYTAGVYVEATQAVNSTISGVFGGKTISDISPADLNAISDEEKAGYENQLSQLKQTLRNNMAQRYPTMDITEVDNRLEGTYIYIDDVIAAVKGERALEAVQTRIQFEEELMKHGLMNTPTGQAIRSFSLMAPNTPLPPSLTIAAEGEWLKIMSGRKVDLTAMPQDTKNSTTDYLTRIVRGEDLREPEKADGVLNALLAFSDSADEGGVNDKQQALSVLAQPRFKDIMNTTTTNDPRVISSSNMAARYAVRSAQGISTTLASLPALDAPRTAGVRAADRMNFSISNDGLFSVQANTDNRFDQQTAFGIQKTHIERLNTAIKAQANLTGRSTKEVSDQLITNNPAAFSLFIEIEPPTNTLTEEEMEATAPDQSFNDVNQALEFVQQQVAGMNGSERTALLQRFGFGG
jgi:hypothetical protein